MRAFEIKTAADAVCHEHWLILVSSDDVAAKLADQSEGSEGAELLMEMLSNNDVLDRAGNAVEYTISLLSEETDGEQDRSPQGLLTEVAVPVAVEPTPPIEPNSTVQPVEAETAGDLPSKDEGEFTLGSSASDIAHDNHRRATFASVAVKAYAEATGVMDEEPSLAIGDLLGDLRHLCDSLGVDYDELDDRGERHYQPETLGEL